MNVYPPKDGEEADRQASSVQLIDCSEDEDLEAEDVAEADFEADADFKADAAADFRMLLILRLLLLMMSEKQKRMRLLASAGRKPVGAERASISLPLTENYCVKDEAEARKQAELLPHIPRAE